MPERDTADYLRERIEVQAKAIKNQRDKIAELGGKLALKEAEYTIVNRELTEAASRRQRKVSAQTVAIRKLEAKLVERTTERDEARGSLKQATRTLEVAKRKAKA